MGSEGALQKFCIKLFSICGDSMRPKLRAHVTEGTLNAYAKFHRDSLKNMGWQEKYNYVRDSNNCAQR